MRIYKERIVISTGIRGKHGEMEVLRHVKRVLNAMEQSNYDCQYVGPLKERTGFRFFLKESEYEIYRPKKARTDSDDLIITEVNSTYQAMIQIKNIVSRAVTPSAVRFFVGKLIEEGADDGLFVSLSSPVRGDLLDLLNIEYSPQSPDDHWEDGIRSFLMNKVGTRSIKKYRDNLSLFHKDIDSFFGTEVNWRFRDFPQDFSKRLSWLLGFRVPSDSGGSIHFSPSAIFHHDNQRFLFFILPKNLKMDLIRSWRLQQLLLDAQTVYLGISPDHSYTNEKKLKNIKKSVEAFNWEVVSMESDLNLLSPTPYTIKDLAEFPFFDDKLKYSKTNPFEGSTFLFSQLPPCIRNTYFQGVSDGRYHTTLLLSLVKDLTQVEADNKQFFNYFSNVCYERANKAMLAKKRDDKITQTRKIRYFPIIKKLGFPLNLPCDHDGGIWMGAQAIDKVYHQELCRKNTICEQMGDKPDIIRYLRLV